jgi:hypothetical protein
MSMQDKQQVAVQIGRDLPVFVGGIFHGVFSRNDEDKKNRIQQEKQDESKQEDKTSEEDDSSNKVVRK